MTRVRMSVNGVMREAEVEDRTLLVHFLRDALGLTGTHVGCDTTQCGACTVHLNGRAVKSCTVLAVVADGGTLRTIEGMGTEAGMHPVQEAFTEHHALQCGFCTPGMVMAVTALIRRHGGQVDEATIRHELEGNLCRCTGYHNIVRAALAAARTYGDWPGEDASAGRDGHVSL